MHSHPVFTGGINIAMKIPKSKYEATVIFYREVLKLNVEEASADVPTISRSSKVQFGANTLWLDCVDNYSRSEIWLELRTGDVPSAIDYLGQKGTHTCDELEQIPSNMHWITDPAGTVLLLCPEKE